MSLEEQLHSTGLLSQPYPSSPENDWFIFSFIVTYFNVVKEFSLESIRSFTTYDYINLDTQMYRKWVLTEFDTQLLNLYVRCIRVNWMKTMKEDATVLVQSPCGRYASLTGKFFLNTMGALDWAIDKAMVEDMQNNNGLTSWTKLQQHTGRIARPRRSRMCSVNNMRDSNTLKDAVHLKCELQQWIDVDVMENCPGGRGRGLIASKTFQKNEIIVDYHARPISKCEAKDIEDDDDDKRYNYLFCGPNGLFWDGSGEYCICHPQTRLLGRLANFAQKGSVECNAKPQFVEFNYNKKVSHVIILVATRDIQVLEEIRFDYGDKTCLELFK